MSAPAGCPEDDLRELVGRVFVRNRQNLLAVAAAIVGDMAIAEEIVQDAIVAVLKAAPDLSSEADVEPYLRVAIRKHAVRRRRRRARRISRTVSLDEAQAAWQLGVEPSAERRCIVTEALNALPQGFRDVIDLRIQGFIQEDAAREIGVTERTVRRRLKDARRVLTPRPEEPDPTALESSGRGNPRKATRR